MSVTYHPTVVQEITSSDGSLTITVTNGGGTVDLVVVDSAVTLGWDDVLANDNTSNGTSPVVSAGDTLTLTDFTSGSIPFSVSGVLTQNNSGLFWDSATNRLGVGGNTPADRLDVTGRASVHNNSATAFYVTDTTTTIFNVDTSTPAVTVTAGIVVTGTTTFNTVAYTWPGADGTANFVLSTNGSGTLSWVDNAATVDWNDVLTNDANSDGVDPRISFGDQISFIGSMHGNVDLRITETNGGEFHIEMDGASSPVIIFSNTDTPGVNFEVRGNDVKFGRTTTANDTVLSFVSAGNTGVITWDQTADEFIISDDILMNSTEAIQFNAATENISGLGSGILSYNANLIHLFTAPAFQIVASTGMTLSSANLNSAWTVNTTNQIRFRDTGIFLNSPSDGILNIEADGNLQIGANTVDYVWPTSDGSANDVMITSGGGALSFVDVDTITTTETLAATLTAGNTSSGTNIEMSTSDQIRFRESTITINSSVAGRLDIDATTIAVLTAPTITLVASTGLNLAASTLITSWLTDTNNEHQFRASTNRVYSSATDTLDVEGNVTTNIGKVGDTILGDTTTRVLRPASDGDIDLGTTSIGFNDAWFIGTMNLTEGALRLNVDTTNVSDPISDSDLDGIFGTPATVGSGFLAFVDDNNLDTDFWLVASNGTSWYYTQLTKAV